LDRRGDKQMKLNKKGQMLGALQELPAAAIVVVVFILIVTVGFKIGGALTSSETNTAISNNVSLMMSGFSQFAVQTNLVVTIVVMSIIIAIVVSAFRPRSEY